MNSISSKLEQIVDAAEVIREGGIVIFPTETVYGIGADATSDDAVSKIFTAKGRPSKNPLIVHLSSTKQINQFIGDINAKVRVRLDRLAEDFWPGPLSIILPKNDKISELVTAGGDTVAIRIPSSVIAKQIIEEAGLPIAAPSANISNYVSPTRIEHISNSLVEKVEMIIDGGPCQHGLESTVISILDEIPIVLRPGSITVEQIEDSLGEKIRVNNEEQETLQSPGLLSKHYSPKTRLILRDSINSESVGNKKVGAIRFGSKENLPDIPLTHETTLSETGDPKEVAAKLYDAIQKMDSLELDLIVIDCCSTEGVGRAIMDRITRAAA